jgi:aminoglycoside 6'-N-acetyltransferase
MNLRRAAPADLALLHYWDTKPHVIAARGNDDSPDWETEVSRRPDWGEWLIAELDGRPVGVIQIIDPAREETHYWGDVEAGLRAVDIWIGEEADLGRGYGTQMMRLVLERCFAHPEVRAVLIDPLASNTRAHRFYQHLGFQQIDHRTFGDDDCLVYRLEREAWRKRGSRSA